IDHRSYDVPISVGVRDDHRGRESAERSGAKNTERVRIARFVAVVQHQRGCKESKKRVATAVAPDLGQRKAPDRVRDDRGCRDGVAAEAEKARGIVLDDDALRVGLVATEVWRHAMYLATVRRFEVIVATRGVAARRGHRCGASALRGPRAVDAVVVGLPALAADLPLRVLIHDLEEAVGARHWEHGSPVAGEALDDAFPKLKENPGVYVEEAKVNLGVLQIGVVGELR